MATEAGALEPILEQNIQPIAQSTSCEVAGAIYNSSVLHENARDAALHSIAVGILEASEGKTSVKAPLTDQVFLKETFVQNDEVASEKLEKQGYLESNEQNSKATGDKDYVAKELMERRISDVYIMDVDKERATDGNICASPSTEKDANEENTAVEDTAANPDPKTEKMEDEVDYRKLEKTIDLVAEEQNVEALEDRGKEENRGLSEEECLQDNGRSKEKVSENGQSIEIASSNESSHSQELASHMSGERREKEEKLQESSYMASDEKILGARELGKEQAYESQEEENPTQMPVNDLPILQLSAEESVQESGMVSNKLEKESYENLEQIQTTNVITSEAADYNKVEMGTTPTTKETGESELAEVRMTGKNSEYPSSIAIETDLKTVDASKKIESEELGEKELSHNGQRDISISPDIAVPSIQNDEIEIKNITESDTLIHIENNFNTNGATSKADEILQKERKLSNEPEVDPVTVAAKETAFQEADFNHEKDKKVSNLTDDYHAKAVEVKYEETEEGSSDASSRQLTEVRHLLNEEKETEKINEESELVHDQDQCHEKVSDHDEENIQTEKCKTLPNKDGLKEDETQDETGNEKLESISEDKHIKVMAEIGSSNDGNTNIIQVISLTETSENGNTQEPLEAKAKEDREGAKEESERGKTESSHDAVPVVDLEASRETISSEEENTHKEEFDVDVEESAQEHEKKHEKIEEVEAELVELSTKNDLNNETVIAKKPNEENPDDNVSSLADERKIVVEDPEEGGETNASAELIHNADNIDQITEEIKPEIFKKTFEPAYEDQSPKTITYAELSDSNTSESVPEDHSYETVADEESSHCQTPTDVDSMDGDVGGLSASQASTGEIMDKEKDKKEAIEKIPEQSMMGPAKSPTDETPDCVQKKDGQEDNLEYDNGMKTTGTNENITNDAVREKHEEPLSSPSTACEEQIHHTSNIEDKKETGGNNEDAFQMPKTISETLSKQMSQAATNEIEATNMNIASNSIEEIGTTAERSEISNENKLVEEARQEEDMLGQGTELVNSVTASQIVPKEDRQDTVAASEATTSDTSREDNSIEKAIGDSSTSQDAEEENIQKAIDQQEATQNTSAANSESEGPCGSKEGNTELVAEKDKTAEEKTSTKAKTTEGLSLYEEHLSEELDKRAEPGQGQEFSDLAVDSGNFLEETASEEIPHSLLQKDKWEDKLENPSNMMPEKIIVAEESSFTQVVEDPPKKQEERYQEKDPASMMLEQAQAKMDTEHICGKPHKAQVEEQIHDSTNTNKGIEVDKHKQDASPKLELASELGSEDKDLEMIDKKEAGQIENSTIDNNIKNTIATMAEKNDDSENTEGEDLPNESVGDNSDSQTLVEETRHVTIGEMHKEGYQTTYTKDSTQVDAAETETEIEELRVFSESLAEGKRQEATGESEAIKTASSRNDDSPNNEAYIEQSSPKHIAEDLTKDIETIRVKDHEFLNKSIEDSSGSHELAVTDPIDPKHKESTKTVCEEQIHQSSNVEENVQVNTHRDLVDSESEFIPQFVPENHSQEHVGQSETRKTYGSADEDDLKKLVEISEIVDLDDDHEIGKVKDEDTWGNSIGQISDINVFVAEATQHGVGDKHENICRTTSNEDDIDVDVHRGTVGIEKPDNDSKLEPNNQSLDHGIFETKSIQVEKVASLQKDEDRLILREETTNDPTSASFLQHHVAERSDELESDEKQESTSMNDNRDEEILKEKENVDGIPETSATILSKNEAEIEIDSEGQTLGKGATKDAPFITTGCQVIQKNDKHIASAVNVEESDTTIVAQTFIALTEPKSIETKILEDQSQTLKTDAYKGQIVGAKEECQKDTSVNLLTEENKYGKKEDEDNKNEILDVLPLTSGKIDKAALRSLEEVKGEPTTKPDFITTGIPNQENDNILIQSKESEALDLKNEESIIKSDDNLTAIAELVEEIKQENQHDKTSDSSYEEQTHEGINKSDSIVTDVLKEENKTAELEKASASAHKEQNHEEVSSTGVDDNNKISTEAKTNDEDSFRSSTISRGMEDGEINKAYEDKVEILEPEKEQEEDIPVEEEASVACLAVPNDLGPKKLTLAPEVELFSFQSMQKEEEANGIDGEESMETRDDNSFTQEASFEENLKESASTIISEEQIHVKPEEVDVAERPNLKNENKEEQEVQTSSQMQETKDEKQMEERKILKEQKPHETINTNKTNDKEVLEEEETSKSSSEKENLEGPKLEQTLHVVLEGLETAPGTDYITEKRIKSQATEYNLEENSKKDGDDILVVPTTELGPGNQSHESFTATHTEEGALPHVKILHTKNINDEVGKMDASFEDNQLEMSGDLCVANELVEETTDMEALSHLQVESSKLETIAEAQKIDSIVTRNEDIDEESEILNVTLQNDVKALNPLEEPSDTISDSLDMTDPRERIEKIMAKEETAEGPSVASAYDETTQVQFQEVEENPQRKNAPETKWKPEEIDTNSKDEVEESDCQPLLQKQTLMATSEKLETASSIDKDLESNPYASSGMAPLVEETKQESKISDCEPGEYNEEVLNATAGGTELLNEEADLVDGQTQVENNEDTSDSASIDVESKEVPNLSPNMLLATESSGTNVINEEGNMELAEALNLTSKEEVSVKDDSPVRVTEDKESLHRLSTAKSNEDLDEIPDMLPTIEAPDTNIIDPKGMEKLTELSNLMSEEDVDVKDHSPTKVIENQENLHELSTSPNMLPTTESPGRDIIDQEDKELAEDTNWTSKQEADMKGISLVKVIEDEESLDNLSTSHNMSPTTKVSTTDKVDQEDEENLAEVSNLMSKEEADVKDSSPIKDIEDVESLHNSSTSPSMLPTTEVPDTDIIDQEDKENKLAEASSLISDEEAAVKDSSPVKVIENEESLHNLSTSHNTLPTVEALSIDIIDQEDKEKLAEVSKLMSKEEADLKDSCPVEVMEDKGSSHSPPMAIESEVNQSTEEKKSIQLEEKASHKVEDLDSSQIGETELTKLNDLPISQILMDHISQQVGGAPKKAYISKSKDKIHEEDEGGEKNVAEIANQGRTAASLTVEQITGANSIPEHNVVPKKLESNVDDVESTDERDDYCKQINDEILNQEGTLVSLSAECIAEEASICKDNAGSRKLENNSDLAHEEQGYDTKDRLEKVKPEKTEEDENTMKEEAADACLKISSDKGSKEPAVTAEVEHLSPQNKDKEDAVNGTDLKANHARNPSSVSHQKTETISGMLSIKEVSLDENMQRNAPVEVPDEHIHCVPQDIRKTERATLNENKEEQKGQTSSQEKEVEDERQEEENEIWREQKETQEEKKTSESGSERKKLEDQELQEPIHEVPKRLEKGAKTERIDEQRFDLQEKYNNPEESFQKGDEILGTSIAESEFASRNIEPIHAHDTTEGTVSHQNLKAATLSDKVETSNAPYEESKHENAENLFVTHGLAEEIKDVDASGPLLRMEELELGSHNEAEEHSEVPMVSCVTNETSYEEFHEDENKSQKIKESREVKESECQSSQQKLRIMGSPEKKESPLPTKSEDPGKNAGDSSVITPFAEDTKQEVGEKFDKVFVPEINMKTEEVPEGMPSVLSVIEALRKGANDQDSREEQEVSNLVPKNVEQVHSPVAATEDKEKPQRISPLLEQEVSQPAELDNVQLTDEASHEAIEFDNKQSDESQEDFGELPVSQFLMHHILREEGDMLEKDREVKPEEKLREEDNSGEQYEADISKPEGTSFSLFAGQITEETGLSDDKVSPKKHENTPDFVPEDRNYDVRENAKIPLVNDNVSTHSSPHGLFHTLAMEGDIKDGVSSLLSDVPANVVANDSIDMASTVQRTQENKEDIEVCMNPDMVQDEKTQTTISEKRVMEKVIRKDNKTPNEEADTSSVSKASEGDISQQEGREECKEILQDVEKIDKVSYLISQGEQTTISESTEESSLVHGEETQPNPQHDQVGKSSDFSISDVQIHEENLEIEPEVKDQENGEENQDKITESQMRKVENDLPEGSSFPESQEAQQSDLAVKPTNQTIQAAGYISEERSSAVSTDEKQTEKTTYVQAEEEKEEKEEEDEHNPKESNIDTAAISEVRYAGTAPVTEATDEKQTVKITYVPADEDKVDEEKEEQEEEDEHNPEESNINTAEVKEVRYAGATAVTEAGDEKQTVKTTYVEADEDKVDEEQEEKEEEDEDNPEESNLATAAVTEVRYAGATAVTGAKDEKQTAKRTYVQADEDKVDEEKEENEEEDEHNPEKSNLDTTAVKKVRYADATAITEARDADPKPAHKKSHNILSGVGSKVKHSIAKVKKAITGKSSHSKTSSAN